MILFRKMIADFVYPEGRDKPHVAINRGVRKNQLIKLAELYGSKLNLSHWAVSMRILKKGDFFQRLYKGKDCQTGTANKVINWFSENWPADLDWPSDIPRPANMAGVPGKRASATAERNKQDAA